MNDRDSNTYDNEQSIGEQRDASAGWRAEYSHQGIRFVGAFTSHNGDHDEVAGPRDGVSLSDYADGGGVAREGDQHDEAGDR